MGGTWSASTMIGIKHAVKGEGPSESPQLKAAKMTPEESQRGFLKAGRI